VPFEASAHMNEKNGRRIGEMEKIFFLGVIEKNLSKKYCQYHKIDK
jgi:hypothetical protein